MMGSNQSWRMGCLIQTFWYHILGSSSCSHTLPTLRMVVFYKALIRLSNYFFTNFEWFATPKTATFQWPAFDTPPHFISLQYSVNLGSQSYNSCVCGHYNPPHASACFFLDGFFRFNSSRSIKLIENFGVG